MSAQACILFAKTPSPGFVKTRLAADIGEELAAKFYEACLQDLVERLAVLSGADLLIAHALVGDYPVSEASAFTRLLVAPAGIIAQQGKDLGERMANAFSFCFSLGYARLAILSSDTPTLQNRQVLLGLELAGSADVVVGPSPDGGYYLVALSRPQPGIFEGIAWGGDQVLAQTLKRCQALGLSTELLEPTADVDCVDDLRELHRRLLKMDPCYQDHLCPRVFNLLQSSSMRALLR